MKLFSAVVALILPLTALAALGATDVFSSYYAKSLSNPSLKLDDGIFTELTAAPRNHSVLVCLTALDARFGCKMCQDFKPEWELLAKSWVKGDRKAESRVLFGQLDFANGRQTFETVCLWGVAGRGEVIVLMRDTDAIANSTGFDAVPPYNWTQCPAQCATSPFRFQHGVC